MSKNRGFIGCVRIRNVRSYEEAKVDLTPGLNVIIGESDSGKSNLVRNLRSLVFNDSSAEAFRRIGMPPGDAARIEVNVCSTSSLSPSFDVGLMKGKDVNEYDVCEYTGVVTDSGQQEVRREVFKNVGRGVPPHVSGILGLGSRTLGGEEVDLHFITQRGSTLLIDDSEGRTAKIIGAVSGIEALIGAIKTATVDRREVDKSRDIAEALARSREADLKEFDEANDLGLAASHLESAGTSLEVLCRAEQAIEGLFTGVKSLERSLAQRDRARSRLRRSKEPLALARRDLDALKPILDEAVKIEEAAALVERSEAERIKRFNSSEAATKKLSKARDELRKIVDRLGVCPACGRESKR